jgi:hypothetical protein
MAGSYEFFEVDIQELFKTVREDGGNKFDVSEVNAELIDFNLYLDKDAIPLIKNIYAKSVKLKINLQSDNNLPNLMQLMSLCSKNVTDRIVQLEDKFIREKNLVTIASILNCNAIINYTSFELHHFIYNNEDLIKQNDFYNEIKRFYNITYDLSRIISQETLFFLTYLQPETNTYPKSIQ